MALPGLVAWVTCDDGDDRDWAFDRGRFHDPWLHAVAGAARELGERRRAWFDSEGAGEPELKKRTLTNLYNQRPARLARLPAALDRAFWAAYGWDDAEPGAVEEDEILGRLLALNRERAATGRAPSRARAGCGNR